MHGDTEPFIFQNVEQRLSEQAELSSSLRRHCVVHTKPCKCGRFGLESKHPRDMVRFQIMTYNTKTGLAIKSVFELIFFFFLIIFPSFPVIMLHP